uniref:Uncharacterized protein n=1 Tax=Anguilla anguilla TaxID=7936 RepID=A0A0E9QVL8_ANGAN
MVTSTSNQLIDRITWQLLVYLRKVTVKFTHHLGARTLLRTSAQPDAQYNSICDACGRKCSNVKFVVGYLFRMPFFFFDF